MPKVSVIIPVYNTAPWLRRCLDSVCEQTLQDIEIICINDNSPDNSIKILNKYTKKDNRIIIVSLNKNCGVAISRNIGISISKGEYISFIDSDDAIELDFFDKLYSKALESNSNIIKACRKKIHEDNSIEYEPLNELIHKNTTAFTWQFTTAIYNKNFIIENELNFPQNVTNAEDVSFLYKLISNNPTISFVNTTYYLYYRRKNSMNPEILSRQHACSGIDGFIDIIKYINKKQVNIDIYNSIHNNLLYTSLFRVLKVNTEDRVCILNKSIELYNYILNTSKNISINKELLFIYTELIKNNKHLIDMIINTINLNSIKTIIVKYLYYSKNNN